MISFETGESITYGLYNAQERGTLFIGAGIPVYGGMIIGVSPRSEDMTVNICKKKQLTNTRASGSDEALRLVTPRQMSLEQCLEFLADDELLEVTPKSLRMRKRILDHALQQVSIPLSGLCQHQHFAALPQAVAIVDEDLPIRVDVLHGLHHRGGHTSAHSEATTRSGSHGKIVGRVLGKLGEVNIFGVKHTL